MRISSIPRIVWFAPAIVLVIAVSPLPYGYYTFTRIVTCAVAALIAIVGLQEKQTAQVWSVMFAAIAVLFNPFVPIHLNRATWVYIDLGAAAALLSHLFFVRRKFT